MKKLSAIASALLSLSVAGVALPLVACSGGSQPDKAAPKVAAATAPAATPAPAAATAAPAAATEAPDAHKSQAAEPPAEIGKLPPSQDPANQRGGKRYEGGIDKLDSKYDLSKVKLDDPAQHEAHDEHDGHDHGAEDGSVPNDGSSLLPAAQAQIHAGRFELVDDCPQVKDLGKLRQGDKGAFDFAFQSNGKEPLVISGIKPSCGCTKAEITILAEDGARKPYTKGDPIPVGTKFFLESEINTDGRQGAFNSQVALYGNDARGAFTVRITADVEPVLLVKPNPTVFFGRITTKDKVEQSVTVETTRGEPFLLTLAQEPPQENLGLEFTAKNPDAEGKASLWEIKVSLGPSTAPGMKSYPINFESDLAIENPKYPSADGKPQHHGFVLNLQAQVLGMVSAEPPFLTFGMVKPGEAIERSLRLECHDDFKLKADMPVVLEGLQAQALPWADRFKITIEPLEDGKAANLKVLLTGLPDDVTGSIGGQIRIKVGHPYMEEVPIRFSAVCRPGLPTATPAVGQPQAKPAGQQK